MQKFLEINLILKFVYSSFPEAGVRGSPPGDVRGLVKVRPPPQFQLPTIRRNIGQRTLCEKTKPRIQLAVYYSQTEGHKATPTSRCGPKSPHLIKLIISKFCYCYQVGFQHILPSICHHQHICNIINYANFLFLFLTPTLDHIGRRAVLVKFLLFLIYIFSILSLVLTFLDSGRQYFPHF